MFKKHLHILLSFALIITLYSCEGETRSTWKLENNSSETLRVYPKFLRTFMASDTLTISPMTIIEIAVYSDRGGRSEPGSATENIEEMIVFNRVGDTVQKDVFMESNWGVDSRHRKRVPSLWDHRFTFTISESDL
jgi:hypothetical protein